MTIDGGLTFFWPFDSSFVSIVPKTDGQQCQIRICKLNSSKKMHLCEEGKFHLRELLEQVYDSPQDELLEIGTELRSSTATKLRPVSASTSLSTEFGVIEPYVVVAASLQRRSKEETIVYFILRLEAPSLSSWKLRGVFKTRPSLPETVHLVRLPANSSVPTVDVHERGEHIVGITRFEGSGTQQHKLSALKQQQQLVLREEHHRFLGHMEPTHSDCPPVSLFSSQTQSSTVGEATLLQRGAEVAALSSSSAGASVSRIVRFPSNNEQSSLQQVDWSRLVPPETLKGVVCAKEAVFQMGASRRRLLALGTLHQRLVLLELEENSSSRKRIGEEIDVGSVPVRIDFGVPDKDQNLLIAVTCAQDDDQHVLAHQFDDSCQCCSSCLVCPFVTTRVYLFRISLTSTLDIPPQPLGEFKNCRYLCFDSMFSANGRQNLVLLRPKNGKLKLQVVDEFGNHSFYKAQVFVQTSDKSTGRSKKRNAPEKNAMNIKKQRQPDDSSPVKPNVFSSVARSLNQRLFDGRKRLKLLHASVRSKLDLIKSFQDWIYHFCTDGDGPVPAVESLFDWAKDILGFGEAYSNSSTSLRLASRSQQSPLPTAKVTSATLSAGASMLRISIKLLYGGSEPINVSVSCVGEDSSMLRCQTQSEVVTVDGKFSQTFLSCWVFLNLDTVSQQSSLFNLEGENLKLTVLCQANAHRGRQTSNHFSYVAGSVLVPLPWLFGLNCQNETSASSIAEEASTTGVLAKYDPNLKFWDGWNASVMISSPSRSVGALPFRLKLRGFDALLVNQRSNNNDIAAGAPIAIQSNPGFASLNLRSPTIGKLCILLRQVSKAVDTSSEVIIALESQEVVIKHVKELLDCVQAELDLQFNYFQNKKSNESTSVIHAQRATCEAIGRLESTLEGIVHIDYFGRS